MYNELIDNVNNAIEALIVELQKEIDNPETARHRQRLLEGKMHELYLLRKQSISKISSGLY